MAVSKTFFGPRRGSTKSSTFQLYRGQQITKDRVTEVSNPQTSAQGLQRMRVAAVSNAAARLRPLISQSFEGVPYGEKSVQEFMRINLAKNGPCQFQCYPKKGENTPGLSTLMVSKGSLPSLDIHAYGIDYDAFPAIYFLADTRNIDNEPDTELEARSILLQLLKQTFGLETNDQLTILLQIGNYKWRKPSEMSTYIPYYTPGCKYVISRIILNEDSPVAKRWKIVNLSDFGIEQVTGKMFSDGNIGILLTGLGKETPIAFIPSSKILGAGLASAYCGAVTGTIIHTRFSNGRWLRSTQCLPMNPTESYVQTAEEAWPSYLKKGESTKYLNAGSESVSIIGG